MSKRPEYLHTGINLFAQTAGAKPFCSVKRIRRLAAAAVVIGGMRTSAKSQTLLRSAPVMVRFFPAKKH